MKDNTKRIPVILGSHRSVNEVLDHLACYEALIRSWLPTFRDILSGSSTPRRTGFFDCLRLHVGAHRPSRNVGNQLRRNAE